ncbi:MAG: DEAD/DEAH box helicase family protein [Acidobacteriota bacterium]
MRQAQLRALDTYWYLRLKEDTPHILDLYSRLFPRKADLIHALGVPEPAFGACDYEIDELFNRIRTDDAFVHDFQLESLRETLSLEYPSYILALAMGAGKTILIGAIIATEFAMALEYPGGPFVQNALVFAPGMTILESLRELAAMPYEQILPPRLHKPFAASVKLTFTRDGEKDIPVIRGSSFNVVVTNTEKIRIQKEKIRKTDLGGLFSEEREEDAKSEVANLRLQSIASLPHLAVFSDEAHHTYGQSLDQELKKVRKTVDYLAAKTNVICVVNTTGTPYFKRQALKDVVTWYGLSEGIRDGILKDLAGNIQTYEFEGDARAYVGHVIEDFFKDYGGVSLPSGTPSKLAIYFPQTDDLKELKPTIDATLVRLGLSPALCLVNTSDESLTKPADIAAFNHLNDPGAPHRVILLVNKGTEGWNCPSLFACALARKLKSSNNFVLQAATRCLRQVPGNAVKARVYLSSDNFGVLDRQLQETYGEGLADLNRTGHETARAKIVLKKLDIPPLVVTRVIRTVAATAAPAVAIKLTRPGEDSAGSLRKAIYTVSEQAATDSVLRQLGPTVTIDTEPGGLDAYAVAADLAARYRLDLWPLVEELRRLYGTEDVPEPHQRALAGQLEQLTRAYEVKEERVDVALALVKPEGFTKELDETGVEVYTAEIVYPKDREYLLVPLEKFSQLNPAALGFHYNPYNFDSNPELSLFEQVLARLNLKPAEVEDIYFTGALTDPAKTDFFVEYKDDKGKWRNYTPDFVIRRKPPKGGRRGSGKAIIVEVKAERERAHPVDGEKGRKAMALRAWENLNPKLLKYEMIFTASDTVGADQVAALLPPPEKEPAGAS